MEQLLGNFLHNFYCAESYAVAGPKRFFEWPLEKSGLMPRELSLKANGKNRGMKFKPYHLLSLLQTDQENR
jgi:hypothetical protein